jgi:hypothetical protein
MRYQTPKFALSLTRALTFAVALLLVVGQGAQAEERIALIVGNGSYASVSPLDNPVPDADLMALALKDKGFKVTKLTDATQIELNRGIAQFGRDLRTAGSDATGLFYYAGHAVQSFGSNFLLPVDASLTDAADLSLVAVQANAVLRQMFSAKNKTNIVILDACRNNPFEAIAGLNDNGLAEMKAPTGTFLSYSTAPGAVALDGLDGNSPFTKSLARAVQEPGVQIENVFKNVRVDVIAQTNGQQTPWDTSSLTGDFFFEAAAEMTAEEVAEQQLWDSVQSSTDPVPLLLFIRGYPNSVHIPEARALLSKILTNELTGDTSVQAPAPAAPAVVEPPKKVVVQEPVAAPEPAPASDIAQQETLIGVAQQSGLAVDYQAYLDSFPNGIYAELAGFELDILEQKAQRAAAAEALTPAPAPQASTAFAFDLPLTIGVEHLSGKSIEQLITMTPLYAPFEGLPEELWKDQQCSSCHGWTKKTLCDQGQTYVTANNERAVSKTHPFGGGFKRTLRGWAQDGCK